MPEILADEQSDIHVPRFGLAIGLVMLAILIIVVARHFGEAREFVSLLHQAEPLWIIVGILSQLGTYVCVATIWNQLLRPSGHVLKLRTLTRLSIEKITVNQLIPTSGVVGNLVIARAMKSRGIPTSLAMEALLFDIFTYYASFLLMAVLALGVLWWLGDITRVVLVLLGFFVLIISAIVLAIGWLLWHRHWKPPWWLAKWKLLQKLLEEVSRVRPKHILSPALFSKALLFQTGIFLFDAVTLWAMLKAVGLPTDIFVPFIAFMMSAIASSVSFIPGGIGSFEAASTATLTFLGVPVEAALTATLLLRGLTLWIPLIPGFFFARHDIVHRHRA